MAKTAVHDLLYALVLVAIVMQILSFMFLVAGIDETGFTLNIPYETLAFEIIGALIMAWISFTHQYYIHFALYLTAVAVVGYITYIKVTIEGGAAAAGYNQFYQPSSYATNVDFRGLEKNVPVHTRRH